MCLHGIYVSVLVLLHLGRVAGAQVPLAAFLHGSLPTRGYLTYSR